MDEYAKLESRADRDRPQSSSSPPVIRQAARYAATPEQQPLLTSASLGSSENSRLSNAMSPRTKQDTTGPAVAQHRPARDSLCHLLVNNRARSVASMSPPPASVAPPERQASIIPRSLPVRDITDATIDDAFVQYILYCNPFLSLSVDTTELRRVFRSPPKSEGKSFSTYILWELIQKFNRKELKTWIQLAMALGVEPPSLEKKQSTQKVQQYAVRLKRWMHATHIDSFFEYCLGHPHPYYTQAHLCHERDEEGRDGVPREEDLALRALVPGWKPKKGRKRADESVDQSRPTKKLHLLTSMRSSGDLSANPASPSQNTTPWSAFPGEVGQSERWNIDSALRNRIATTRRAMTPEQPARHLPDPQWGFPRSQQSPHFPYPQSAVIPRHQDLDASFPPHEPQSAITPSSSDKGRYKRRGRPLSSAWLGASSNATRSRGRPSAHSTPSATPRNEMPLEELPVRNYSPDAASSQNIQRNSSEVRPSAHEFQSPAQPSKLQLHMPQSTVVMTPPLTSVTGQHIPSISSSGNTDTTRRISSEISVENDRSRSSKDSPRSPNNLSMESVVEALMSQLGSAIVRGSTIPLESTEAHAITHSMLRQIKSQAPPHLPPEVLASYCAMCLGVTHRYGLTRGPPAQFVIKFLSDPSQEQAKYNHHLPHINNAATGTPPMRCTVGVQYILNYDYSPHPGITTHASLRGTILPQDVARGDYNPSQLNPEGYNDRYGEDDALYDISGDEPLNSTLDEHGWKQRYMSLRNHLQKKEAAIQKYKKQILEAVMDDV